MFHKARLKFTIMALVVAGSVSLAMAASPAQVTSATHPSHKTIDRVLKSIRYKRDAKALGLFNGTAQGKLLMGRHWSAGSAAQQTEFVSLFHQMFAGLAFPKIRSNLKHLETVLYSAPQVSGADAKVDSTIVILHALKKQELLVRFDLHKTGAAWQVVDVTVKGNPSMLTGIREGQINKIMAKGGWPKLLELLRKRVAKLKK